MTSPARPVTIHARLPGSGIVGEGVPIEGAAMVIDGPKPSSVLWLGSVAKARIDKKYRTIESPRICVYDADCQVVIVTVSDFRRAK